MHSAEYYSILHFMGVRKIKELRIGRTALLLLCFCLLVATGCGTRITGIAESQTIWVKEGTSFDSVGLPTTIGLIFEDGSTGEAAVTWDTSAWFGKQLQESIILSGKVKGTKLQATLRLEVQPAIPELIPKGTPVALDLHFYFVDSRAGAMFDDISLPGRAFVWCSDSSKSTAPVVWNTGGSVGKRLEKTLIVDGSVVGIPHPVRVVVVALPELTAEQAVSEDAASLMADKLKSDPAFRQVTWSPNGSKVVFTVHDELGTGCLYIWSVGSTIAQRANGELRLERFYEHLAWSFDGRYLAVHDSPGFEKLLFIMDSSSLEDVQTLIIWGIGYWSPDSNEILVASLQDNEETTYYAIGQATDLVLLDVSNGSRRVLVDATDAKTLFKPQGWAGPGQAVYTRVAASGSKDGATQWEIVEDLVISTRP